MFEIFCKYSGKEKSSPGLMDFLKQLYYNKFQLHSSEIRQYLSTSSIYKDQKRTV